MSELRQDRTTGGWVIVAPNRGHRPGAPAKHTDTRRASVRFDPKCPFCPGNERELPAILAETTAGDVGSGWSVRVVPNKYPALEVPLSAGAPRHPNHDARPGHGFHEVVIESRRHDADLPNLSAPDIDAITATYRARVATLALQQAIEATVLFRNHGGSSGASLTHPHAQIIALSLVPPRLAAMVETGRAYFERNARCAMCDELAFEIATGARVVEDGDRFAVLVPFAAERPFEMWIVPKEHRASFIEIGDDERSAFGQVLARTLRRIETELGDPSYHFVLETAPRNHFTAPYFHWRLRIMPEVVTWGGFEIGTGLPINPSRPEDDAARLRAADMADGGAS